MLSGNGRGRACAGSGGCRRTEGARGEEGEQRRSKAGKATGEGLYRRGQPRPDVEHGPHWTYWGKYRKGQRRQLLTHQTPSWASAAMGLTSRVSAPWRRKRSSQRRCLRPSLISRSTQVWLWDGCDSHSLGSPRGRSAAEHRHGDTGHGVCANGSSAVSLRGRETRSFLHLPHDEMTSWEI